MGINEFADKLKIKNAKGYLVGGYVRDKIISEVEKTPFSFKDRDYAVTGLSISEFEELFPAAKKVGTEALIYENGEVKKEKTPVYLLNIDGEVSEIALARSEIKIGDGHQGFAFVYDKEATILDDLKRRDFTMNAMAIDLETNELIDPFDGKKDIEKKQIKGIFLEEEVEINLEENEIKMLNNEFYLKKDGKILSCKLPQDPLRGIRAGRFASKLGNIIEEDTLRALEQLESDMKNLSISRIYEETKKALVGNRPDLFLQTMKEAQLLKEFLPEIDVLEMFEQPANKHPEGNTFIHTKQVGLAASILTKELLPGDKNSLEMNVIATFFHDTGKAVTQTYNEDKKTYQYIGHEKEGVPIVQNFLKRWNLVSWKNHLETVTGSHMLMHNDFSKMKAGKIAAIFSGSFKKVRFGEKEIEEWNQYFINKNDLKNVTNLDLYVKEITEKQKGMNPLLKRVAIKFKQEINSKRIMKKDWEEAKGKGREVDYIKEKLMTLGTIKNFYYYEKENGIEDKMDCTNFYIICASDTLGRLNKQENIVDIFKEAAQIIKENSIGNQEFIEQKIKGWKDTYSLEDSYVEDFKGFLKNQAIAKEYNENKHLFKAVINEEILLENGKKPDDVAFAKSESKRRQEIDFIKSVQKKMDKKSENIVDLKV